MTSLKIAIVGGGIGGLTLAASLAARGVSSQLFEQADELEEIGAGLSMFANSLRLLEELGVAQEIYPIAAEVDFLKHRNGKTGDPVAMIPLGSGGAYRNHYGTGYHTVHRQTLQDKLLLKVPAGTVQLGHRLVGLEDTGEQIRLSWADGSLTDADVVVGADGIRSTVRRCITGRDNTLYSGTSGFRGIVASKDVPALTDPNNIQFWVGYDKHLLHFPIDPDASRINFLAVLEQPKVWDSGVWRRPADTAAASAEFADWHPAVRQMIEAAPRLERWGLFVVEPLDTWVSGRAVLMGDAAHGMLPHLGQGANQSIEDAVVLAGLLADATSETLAASLAEFEQLRKARTERVQQIAWNTNSLLHLPDGPAANQRNAALPKFYDNYGWLHGFDARDQHPTGRIKVSA